MLHFHDDLIESIERGDAKAAGRAVEDNFRETDVRLQLLLQNGSNTDATKKRRR
jgi:hypothetical protein